MLVATDIAARGIDIDQLPQVVNFDLPSVPEDYVHRIGRTGRAGALGHAISLVSDDEVKQLEDIERSMKQKIRREYYPGFEPQHEVPETDWRVRKHAAKKRVPKKPHSNRQPPRAPKTRERRTNPVKSRSRRQPK